jgi:mandelamide amidase
LGTDEQLALTASEAVTAMAQGNLTAVAYTTTLLDRAEKLAGLNAIITLDREGALAAAARIDAARKAGTAQGPLAGLPILVKDNINTKHLPTTAGTPALRDLRPTSDAAVLRPLLAAGAIILGKANMQELALGITNTNFSSFAGFAKNPYDRSRIPGGSSGGTGAAIAARIVPAGLGSDTGGSVRIPASFDGIAGLRPSTGGSQHRYSGAGVFPLSHTLDTVGPMGRTVADVALLDSVITGSPVPAPPALAGLRIGTPPVLWSGLEGQVNSVVQAAKQRLDGAGVVFVDVDMPEVLALSDKVIFPVALHEPIENIPKYLSESGATGITVESIAAQIASPDVKTGFGAVVSDAMGGAYPDAVNIYRPQLQKMYSDYFTNSRVDAIMFPTSPVLPAPIDPVNGTGTISVDGGPPVNTFTITIRNMGPGSCAGVPSLSLPAGMTPGGLPVGLNIEGPVDSDSRILAIGMAMESLLGPLPAPQL